MIINVGDTSFKKEFRKWNGWIVAKDVYLAFFDGGANQEVIDRRDDPATASPLREDESIYLEGHGSPGDVGAMSAHQVALLISKLTFPDGYKGNIRAYCCSAGIGTAKKDSGVAGVAAALSGRGKQKKLNGVPVTGAAGVALNCRAYAGETRVFKNDAQAAARIDKAIDATRGGVDDAWKAWVEKHIPPLIPENGLMPGGLARLSPNTLWAAAYMASQISLGFYRQLEATCRNDLIPSGADLTTKKIVVPK